MGCGYRERCSFGSQGGQLVDRLPCSSAGVGEVDRLDALRPPLSSLGVQPGRRSVATVALSMLLLASLWARRSSSHISSQHGDIGLFTPRDVFLGGGGSILQYASYASLMLEAVGAGRASAAILTTLPMSAQLALRKFHLQTGFPSVGWTNDGIVISDGRCCERGNLSRICRTGSGSCPVTLTKASSGWVSVLQRPEMKEAGSFGSKRSTASVEENHSARNSPSWVEYQSVCQLLKSSVYTAGAGESGNGHCSGLLGGGL